MLYGRSKPEAVLRPGHSQGGMTLPADPVSPAACPRLEAAQLALGKPRHYVSGTKTSHERWGPAQAAAALGARLAHSRPEDACLHQGSQSPGRAPLPLSPGLCSPDTQGCHSLAPGPRQGKAG